MEKKNFVKVSTYMFNFVLRECYRKFLELMAEWDGGTTDSVFNSFYNVDVLKMKEKESKE